MNSLKASLVCIYLLGLVGWLTACGAGAATSNLAPAEASSGQLKVVATFSILGDLVQNVGGAKIDLHPLVGPGGDTHTFEPSPADSVALVEAQLIFENGLGLEPWLNDLYEASGSQASRVVVTAGLEAITLVEEGEHEEHAAESDHGEFDPHVWHDVTNVMRAVEVIRAALAEADPANAQTYQTNAEAYLTQLQDLDRWIAEEVKKLPPDRRKLVTSHDTFGYFARRYGFEVIGSSLGASTEAGDPSAAQIASLIEKIKAAGVPVIFAENVSNPKLMAQIAAEAGVTFGPELYTDALSQPGSAGDTYLNMMRYNVTALVTALK